MDELSASADAMHKKGVGRLETTNCRAHWVLKATEASRKALVKIRHRSLNLDRSCCPPADSVSGAKFGLMLRTENQSSSIRSFMGFLCVIVSAMRLLL